MSSTFEQSATARWAKVGQTGLLVGRDRRVRCERDDGVSILKTTPKIAAVVDLASRRPRR